MDRLEKDKIMLETRVLRIKLDALSSLHEKIDSSSCSKDFRGLLEELDKLKSKISKAKGI